MVFLGLFWFVPFALITAELGSAFPEEGGPYVWARLAFGPLVGALTGVVYWVSVPLWLGGSLVIVSLTAIEQSLGPITGSGRYFYGVAFIWFAVGASIVGFKTGKWLISLGGFLRIVLLVFFSVSVLIYAARHGIHGVRGRDFLPSYATFIAVVPVLVFNFTGLELGSTASEEMVDPQRDVPRVITRSALAAMLLYGVPILSILVVLPASQVTGVSGFLGAARAVFTVYGGSVSPDGNVYLTGAGVLANDVVTLLFVFGLLTSGASWLMGSDRALAVTSLEGSGPAALGVISASTGTPVRVNLLSGVVSTITMVLAFMLTDNNPNKYFQAVLGLTISTS